MFSGSRTHSCRAETHFLLVEGDFFPPHLSVVTMVAEGGWSPRGVHCESTAVASSGGAAGRWSLVAAFLAL